MRSSGLGQFWCAELKNRWYIGKVRGRQTRFRDLKSRFGEKRSMHDSNEKQGKLK